MPLIFELIFLAYFGLHEKEYLSSLPWTNVCAEKQLYHGFARQP